MPEGVGYGEDQEKLVAELVELQDHWLQVLSPRFQEMVTDHKLYLGYREDKRQAHEKWRAFSWLGDPYALTTTETDAWLEIMNSTDPPFACEGVGTEDEWKARGFERMTDYILRGNSWTTTQEYIFRSLSIQGWKVIKPGWREIKYAPIVRPTKEELIEFDSAVNEALKTGLITSPPDPESQPEEFQGWMESTKVTFPGFPDAPAPKPSETVKYRGPWFYRPSEFELRFDPFVEDWTQHEVFFQRIVKPRSWGEREVEAGRFDAAEFKRAARTGPEDTRLSKWDRDIANQIGFVADDNDPRWKNSDEYWEVWRPHHRTAPYLVILNRTAVVNTSTVHPYWHRQLPYLPMRNILRERHAIGIGSYAQLRRTFADRAMLRDITMDMLLLACMPVFLKRRGAGMTELSRSLKPGLILDVNDVNDFKPGWTSVAGFPELLKMADVLLNDANMMLSTGENVRGQASTVGRVSATESQSRLTQALVRHKKKAERLEEELSAILPQALSLVYQKMPEDDPVMSKVRQEMVGMDEVAPGVADEFTRETFAEDVALNTRFRGATSKLTKELMAQQLKDFLATAIQVQSASGIPVQIMTPKEARAILKRTYETLGQKGAGDIFTAEGDQAVESMLQAHMVTAQTAPVVAQTQAVGAQMQLDQMLNPQPMVDANGQQIDPNTGQPVQQEAPVA